MGCVVASWGETTTSLVYIQQKFLFKICIYVFTIIFALYLENEANCLLLKMDILINTIPHVALRMSMYTGLFHYSYYESFDEYRTKLLLTV